MFSKWYEETLRNNFCLPSFDYGIIDDGNNNGLLLICRSTKENKIETWKYNYFNKHFCLLKSDPIPFASSRTFNLLKYISKVYLNQALIIVNRKSLLYDIVNGTWINLEPAEDCDIPCYSKYAIQKYEDHIFIAIASDGSLNIYSLNLVSLSWKCLSKIDSLLYGHEIIVYKGKIYIFGGVTSKVYIGFIQRNCFINYLIVFYLSLICMVNFIRLIMYCVLISVRNNGQAYQLILTENMVVGQ